ncbi:hypothetical protein BT96DRAFT_947558 [Gymnopus androsaceus JB14]|uniref:Uncharacterized protein n=1 Tax=Gymnopus androsaceus JB14 TaxID=1447944 RepID=A0A6A4GRU6_9AGAR|nr:hypothetical protein BT96DRAFT_947558 [Gymnopus androsaceus JB14]
MWERLAAIANRFQRNILIGTAVSEGVWLALFQHMEFIQLSPMLIHYLLADDMDAAISSDLIVHVAPILSMHLLSWPPSRSENGNLLLVPARNPLNLILATSSESGLTLAELAGLNDSAIKSFGMHLRKRAVCGVQESLLSDFPSIVALRQGLNLDLHDSFTLFSLNTSRRSWPPPGSPDLFTHG